MLYLMPCTCTCVNLILRSCSHPDTTVYQKENLSDIFREREKKRWEQGCACDCLTGAPDEWILKHTTYSTISITLPYSRIVSYDRIFSHYYYRCMLLQYSWLDIYCPVLIFSIRFIISLLSLLLSVWHLRWITVNCFCKAFLYFGVLLTF